MLEEDLVARFAKLKRTFQNIAPTVREQHLCATQVLYYLITNTLEKRELLLSCKLYARKWVELWQPPPLRLSWTLSRRHLMDSDFLMCAII